MNLTQLTSFIRVCDARSLSKAASLIGIAQPALSRQVKALELELGAPLLVRHSWGVSPTPAGQALLEQARSVLRGVDNARDVVRAVATEPAGVVAIGGLSSIAMVLFPRLLTALRADYPKLRPRMIDELSGTLYQRAVRGEIDLAILHDGPALGALEPSPLLSEGIGMVACPALAAAIDPGRARSLADQPLLVSTSHNQSRQRLEALLDGQPLNIVAEVDCLPALLQMLMDGHGMSLLPYSAVHALVDRGVLAFTSLDAPGLRRELVVVRPADRPATLSTIAVERIVRRLVIEMAPAMRWTYAGDRDPTAS